MFQSRHLSVGSPMPPPSKGKLRLYSNNFCPYAQRVHLVLDAKKIPYDVVNVHLRKKPEWLVKKNPVQKLPILELETGETLSESVIVAKYVDTLSQYRQVTSSDPLRRAQDELIVERFNQFATAFYHIYFDAANLKVEEVFASLDVLETELAGRGSLYFAGAKPGLVDYMFWPWFERYDALHIIAGNAFVLPEKRFSKMIQWKKVMREDDAVKASFIDIDNHVKFIKSLEDGVGNFDIMVS